MSEDKQPFASDIILYTSPSGKTRVEVWYQDESFWLTQKRMAELFGVGVNTINIDYDKKAEVTQKFFKTVQNKLHWAVT